MEAGNPSISGSNDESLDAMEARFTDLCKNVLVLDESTLRRAKELLGESKHHLFTSMSAIVTGTPDEVERFWFAFILYSVKRLSARKGEELDTRFTLSHILRATKLKIVDFFKELPQFILRVGPILRDLYGPDWENRLEAKEMQANFVHLSLLSKYYKRAFQEFFREDDANGDKQHLVRTTEQVSDYYRLGWLLFLALRTHVFSRFKDLVTCTNGLVSVLAILILHVPSRFRRFSVHDSQRFVIKDDKQVDLITSLCNKYSTSEDELRRTMEKTNNLIINILKMKPSLASECYTENLHNIATDGLTYFEDLMKESSLSSSLFILEKDYSNATKNEADLDERIFVNDEDSLAGSGSLSGGAMNISGAKRKFDAMSSPTKTVKGPLSPPRTPSSPADSYLHGVSSNMAPTPVTTAMTTAKWLRTVVSPLPSKPSADLEHYLLSCDKDVVNDIMHRAQVILEAIFPSSVLGQKCLPGSLQTTYPMDMIWAEKRRTEALKLYYRVMEAMCKAEAQRLQANNLTLLLVNERFHRCMLACSAELVLATHKAATLLFPTVLDRTGITAFDLSKVIESFIRHEESLPRELRRHLSYLEERLLESMVWEKGSSLYNSLIVARPALSSEINHLRLLAEPMLSLDEIAKQSSISCGGPTLLPLPMQSPGVNGDARSPKRSFGDSRIMADRSSFTSPAKDRLLSSTNLKLKLMSPPLQSSFSSPSRPTPGGGETCAETVTNVFFGKIVKLAAARISGIIERLQLSKHISESVFCLVQQILTRRTVLFFNRHIDQIILCSLYGVCKISHINVTFREIIYNYRKQPHCKPQVFRSVFVERSSTLHSGKTGHEHVDIITFYNEFFIPSIKPLLVEIGHSGSTSKSPQVNNNNDAQCTNSPKLAPFPTLPDVSPKKVSKAHNIYVSPLKSSKMDGLMMSHNSKSYYACVGESTHAYQSPSKDLTAINNRLNGKKVNGKLNFDAVGLVSDSQVVDSLYNGNGNGSTSSSMISETGSSSFIAPVAKLPEKTQQH
ncbi:Retinoblastoma-related protein 1 [Ranunculus cassubicifolius]